MADNMTDGREGALVDGGAAEIEMRARVRDRMGLQLQTNLDNVERGDDEARDQTRCGTGSSYLKS
jgi:hypothetical protein